MDHVAQQYDQKGTLVFVSVANLHLQFLVKAFEGNNSKFSAFRASHLVWKCLKHAWKSSDLSRQLNCSKIGGCGKVPASIIGI